MHFSEKPVTCSKEDHPVVMLNSNSYVIILDPTFASKNLTVCFLRGLVDGDSNINILSCDTLSKLGLKDSHLQPTRTVFHGIMPRLDFLFGTKSDFCHELIWLNMVDSNNPYHILLGRTVLDKFMAVPHYTYLKMKMFSPMGIIMINGDYKNSIECAQVRSRLA
ncbi:hypothetical protein D1007_18438 [Hordeum vulgare]|nr:hypothetical protein D1007_18438 [Hordeum vulgare]